MATTRREFFRNLGNALRGIPHTINGDHITARVNDKDVHINIAPLPDRKIGPTVSFERWQVTITFSTHTNAQRTAFMQTFNRTFHRGGG